MNTYQVEFQGKKFLVFNDWVFDIEKEEWIDQNNFFKTHDKENFTGVPSGIREGKTSVQA